VAGTAAFEDTNHHAAFAKDWFGSCLG